MTDLRRKKKRRCGGSDKLIRAVICLISIAYGALLITLAVLAVQVEDYQQKARAQADAEQAEISEQIAQCKDTPATMSEKETVAEAVKTPSIINDGYIQTLTKSKGVNYYNGLRETYYSSRVAKHMNIGQWWCDANGFWRTSEGYFVVAYTMTLPIGTVFDISMGKAMCCDHCPTANTIDIYTNWG